MGRQESFHSACLMGAWIIDMNEVEPAHAAIARCKAQLAAVLEVRHTLWGVQVRTDSQEAARFIDDHYMPAGVALAA